MNHIINVKYKLGTAQSISDRNTIDASNLLTDKDKEKPTAESLKAACGTGKKRRACAGCTCGLGWSIRLLKHKFIHF